MKPNTILPGSINSKRQKTTSGRKNKTDSTSFDKILKNKIKSDNNVKISKHAKARLEQRNINFNDKKIDEAISLANKKGVKNSLIITDDAVFIANIKSRVIVTAMNKNNVKKKVFTNVDGAVNI